MYYIYFYDGRKETDCPTFKTRAEAYEWLRMCGYDGFISHCQEDNRVIWHRWNSPSDWAYVVKTDKGYEVQRD